MGIRAAWAVAIALLALTAPATGTVGQAVSPPAHPPTLAVGLVTDQVPVPTGRVAVPMSPSAPVQLTLSLQLSNSSRLVRLLSALSDPASPSFRGFLTPEQFGNQFGPTAREVAGARAVLQAAGASAVTTTPGGLGVAALVPASGVSALLGVSLVAYRSPTGALAYTALGTPTLPASLSGIVTGIGGLSDAGTNGLTLSAAERAARPVGQFVVDQPAGVQWDVGSDYAEALGATELWPGASSVPGATYPDSIAIATLLASAYNSTSGVDLPAFDPSVVQAYFNDTLGPGWPTPNITGVPFALPGGTAPPPPGPFGALTDSTQDEYENSLDLEMAGSLAPGASLYTFYFPGSAIDSPLVPASDVADDFALDLATALSHSYGPSHHLAVVSASFGLPEVNDSLWDSELVEATALGVTVVCASGDQGDAPDALTARGPATPTWPATATFGTTGAVSVGGATVTLAGTATSNATATTIVPAFDPNVTAISGASGWYEQLGSGLYAGSEGGTSLLYPEPKWQFRSAAEPAIVNATILQGAGSLGRAGPDVALPANNTIAFVFANVTGTVYLDVLAGTSVAAPLFAGLIADVVAVDSNRSGHYSPLGFVDPELYRIASFYASPEVRGTPLAATDPFTDIVRGSNYEFSAAPGWDPLTGWGWVEAPRLLNATNNATIDGYVYTGPTPTLPHSPTPFLNAQDEYLLIGAGALVAIALVIIAAAPSRPSAPPPSLPRRNELADLLETPVTLPVGSGATFACPYCGGERPAEPTRCPHCGTL